MDLGNSKSNPAPVPAEVLLGAVVDSSEDAIISKDLTGTITSWNRAAERIFGYTAEEVIGGPISIIIPPDKGDEETHILETIRRGETIGHFETTRLRKDGSQIEIAVTISPIVHNGRIVGASKIARDITKEKQTSRDLEEERARLEVTLASIGDGVIVTDTDGLVTFMNPVAESLTGWNSDDALGKPLEIIFNIINESNRRRVENPAARALREGIVVGLANHTILLSRKGVEHSIGDSAAPIRNRAGETLGVVLVFRDVSHERIAAEHQARLAAIIQSSDDAIIGKDLNGIITNWNAGATRLFGYSADEAIGRPISMIIPAERLNEESDILSRLRHGERVDHFETVRITKDRRMVDVSLTISPIRDREGHIIGASKIARDITERKKNERELASAREQLQKHSHELEKVVAERTSELREAIGQLQAFSSSLSHDLRAPLRSLNSFIGIVLNEHARELPDEARQLLDHALNSGTRLHRMIEELLINSQSRLTPADLETVQLQTLIPALIEYYPNLREQSSAIDIKQPLLAVLGSEPLLTQCITNLLWNALKFVPASRAPKINVWTEKHDSKVRLHIRDNGIGISEQDQPRIFKMFTRGANASGIEGTGVGLAIVKRAVNQLHGEIGFTSTPNVGTDFWIELLPSELQP